MKKRIFSLLTTLGMALSLFSTLPAMAWEYGEAGTASWQVGAENPSDILATFTSSDPKNINTLGSFVIEGNGEMEDFLSAPWGWYQELITSVTISEGITRIGNNSFDHGFIKTNYYGGISNLESITLPSTLTSIGKAAFSYCDKLKNVDLPDGLTIINSHAFEGCTGLTDITIPDSVTEIGAEVFDDCTNLTKVTIPDLNITYLGPNIFGNYERSENLTVYCYAGGQVEEYLKKYDINYVTIGQSSHVIDKSELEKAIAEAEAIDENKYTSESVKNLNDASFNGKLVYGTPGSTQLEVDDAVQRIKDAIENLVEKPSESPSETPKTDPSDTPSKPSSDNSSNNPTQPSSNDDTSMTSPTTAAPKVTAPKATTNVVKAKSAAQTAMKQAKITKLTVKSKAKKKITVTWKKVKKAVGYEVEVSSNKKFNKSKILVKKNVKKTKVTIKNKKIKSKKTYYVRVRAYATYKDAKGATQKVYSKWNNKLRKVKVK